MCVISRVMMVLVTEDDPTRRHSPQFKNATILWQWMLHY